MRDKVARGGDLRSNGRAGRRGSGVLAQAHRDFMGAKIALFVGPALLVLHRDDRPGLLWPGHWDFPGGGREGAESPAGCALRETQEEFGLDVAPSAIRWGRAYTNSIGRTVWFFVAALPAAAKARVRFGDEGQGWALMRPEVYAAHPRAVPQLRARLSDYRRGVLPEPLGVPREI
jgi:8-oxo-dGTP diphosphatase